MRSNQNQIPVAEIFRKSLIMLLTLFLFSCSKDEPAGGGSGNRPGEGDGGEESAMLDVNLELDLILPETTAERKKLLSEEYAHRFILELHTVDRATKAREIFYRPIAADDKHHIVVNTRQLPGKYRLAIWSDYVTTDGNKSDHYDASTLIPVKISGGYKANSEAKDCFYGIKDVEIRKHEGRSETVNIQAELSRPVGRMEIVAEDPATFMKIFGARLSQGEKFCVRVVYPQYIATAFNVHDGVMKEMQSGLSFSKELKFTEDDKKMTLAFDYLFADANGTDVPCRIEVTDGDGEKIAVSGVTLPMKRGKNTLISGRFLTSKQEGGVSVDTDYDGVIDIDLGKI